MLMPCRVKGLLVWRPGPPKYCACTNVAAVRGLHQPGVFRTYGPLVPPVPGVLWSLLSLLGARAEGSWLAELHPESIPEWVIVTIGGSPIDNVLYRFNGYL